MKKLAIIILSATLIFSCKKENTNTNEDKNPTESLPSSFIKRVLLEDYSKHCQFCIPLNSVVDSMRHAYPNNSFIPVIISTNHFTEIDYFDTISKVFTFTTFPVGGVDRVPAVNSGTQTGDLIFNKQHWATNIDAQIAKTTDYGLKMESTLEGTNLNLDVTIGSFSANNDLKISVFIIEDDAYYRTLKRVLTNYKGSDLELKANSTTKYIFRSPNLAGYNISKTSIVAFLHYFDEATQNYEVVNVNEVKAGESVGW